MGVYPEGHVHGVVSRQILDLLDVQPSLKQPGDVCMTEDVGRHMGLGQLALYQLPHTLVGGLGEGLAIFHGQHKLGPAALPVFRQPLFQFLGKRQVPAARVRLERILDGGLPFAQDRVVSDVDDLFLEVDVLPHEPQDLTPAHPRMKRDKQEGVGPGVLYPLHQQMALLGRQGRLFGSFTSTGLQHTAYRGFRHKPVLLRRLENAPQMDQYLGLQGVAFLGQRRHNGLDLHRADVPQAVAADDRQDMLVQDILDRVEAVLTQVGLLVEFVPHLGKVAEGFFTADIHTSVDQNLRF